MKLTNLCSCFLLISSLPVFANTPIWVKDGSAFTKDGQITLKSKGAGMVGVSLNHPVSSRISSGRTPNIMVVGNAGGSYSWSHGFRMSNDSYLIYENALATYIEFSRQQMQELFDYDEESFNQLEETGRYQWPNKRVTYSATFTCGNNDYSGSCNYSGNASGDGHGSYSQGSSFSTGFSYTMGAFSDNVNGTFSIPELFQNELGENVRGSASGSNGLYGQCSDTDGSGSTCSRSVSSVSTLSIGYTFIADWRGSGIKVGAYRWYKCCGGSASTAGVFVIGEHVANVPTASFTNLYVSDSATQVVYLLSGNLYSFAPGQSPSVAMSGASSLPLSAININGVKSDIGSPPP